MMQTLVVGNGWRIKDAEILVVRDGLKQLIGPNLSDEFGISVTQILSPIEGNMINNINTKSPFKSRIANHFANLVSRIGLFKVHNVKSKFH